MNLNKKTFDRLPDDEDVRSIAGKWFALTALTLVSFVSWTAYFVLADPHPAVLWSWIIATLLLAKAKNRWLRRHLPQRSGSEHSQ